MKKFFVKLGRFFWSWRFLKFVLWFATLVVFFYVEENWRGARAWAATKAEWEAKGESLDYTKFIPPPIPDDQNLGAIPLFKMEPNPNAPTDIEPLRLQKALRRDLPGGDLPVHSGNWQAGDLPDMNDIRQAFSTAYAQAFPGVEMPQSVLAQFDALYPFTADLRAASAQRPLCRFNADYTYYPPAARPLTLLSAQIKLVHVLTFHAILSLEDSQPDLALADIRTSFLIASGTRRDPSLFGSLLAIAIAAMTETDIYDGLALHEWNDAQLAEIEDTLKPIDFLSDYQFAMRSEAAFITSNIDWIKNRPRSDLAGFLGTTDGPSRALRLYGLWPGGWMDQNKSEIVTYILNDLKSVDPKTHRAFPEIADEIQRQVDEASNSLSGQLPWNIFATLDAPAASDEQTLHFAEGQVWLDETRIACAIERYRIAKNALPVSLDELAPAYLPEVPNDVMNGQPYHYQALPNGTYLLYSVGWNQKDDGGKVVNEEGNKRQKPREGDWVWPMPQAAVAK